MMARESTPLIFQSSVARAISERERALREPGVGHAAQLIKDAVIGHQDAPYEGYYDPYRNEQRVVRNTISIVCGRLVVQLRGAVLFFSWLLFILTFIEPPHWCRELGLGLQIVADAELEDPEYGDCKIVLGARGTTADGEEKQQLYPNASSMLLTINQSKNVELLSTLFIALYLLFGFADDGFYPRLFFYPGKKRYIHGLQCFLVASLFASSVFDYTAQQYNPFLRMLVLGSFLQSFQRELRTFLKMIPELMIPLGMLAVIIVFYAWFGVVIFNGSAQGLVAFPNLADGMWTLWICVTTANYPDVMMPSYNENRFVAIYFVSFMILTFFYIMNVVLAVAVNSYDESIEKRKCYRADLSKALLSEAFTLLDHNGENSVSRESIMNVMTIINQDIPEIRGLSSEEKTILYALLDRDGDNKISSDEFLDFSTVLLVSLAKKTDYSTFVEANFPSLFASNAWQTVCKTVKSKQFEYTIEWLLVLNAVLIAAQDYPQLAGLDATTDPTYREGNNVWEDLETVFTVIYVVECVLKITVNGWRTYIESPKNAFDFLITILVVLASMYVYYPNAYNDRDLIKFVVMARVFRLGRVLLTIEHFRIFGAISIEIIPAAQSVFILLLFIGYFFASLGMLMYGGVITRDPSNPVSHMLLESEDFVEGQYFANSFNDMASSMNVLFNLLVVNNWTTQADGMEHATGNKWTVRLYTLSFYVLGVIGISNVVTSFIINAFFQQLQTLEHRQGPAEAIEGEAVIRGSKAVFDSSTITGTDTGLRHSVYFARIKPRNLDVELDERAALRRLFSRGSSADPTNS